jgi:hypothetical protein
MGKGWRRWWYKRSEDGRGSRRLTDCEEVSSKWGRPQPDAYTSEEAKEAPHLAKDEGLKCGIRGQHLCNMAHVDLLWSVVGTIAEGMSEMSGAR